MGMQIKKYRAPTLQKAIEQVRADLGDGALILQADPLADSPLGRNAVEVTAAIDRKDLTPRFQATLSGEAEERALTLPKARPKKSASFFSGLFGKGKEAVAPSATPKPLPIINKPSDDFPRPSKKKDTSTGQFYAFKTMIEPLQKDIEKIRDSLKSQQKERVERAPSVALLESEIQSLKKSLQHYMAEKRFEGSHMTEDGRKLIGFWKDRGMSDQQIFTFLHSIKEQGLKFDELSIQNHVKSYLSKVIAEGKTLESPKQRIVSLVGPTGVGKTTTIAKLAAFEKLKLNRSVAFVTMDDFKIGGTDQLGHYARILEVPFLKVRSDLSLEAQLKHLKADTIFVDTFGVSPKDQKRMLSLRRALTFKDEALRARTEVHLTLPVSIQHGDVEFTLESFARLQPNYLLFTKWDETENWGGMLATILASEIPVSFVGSGQEVPDDISSFSCPGFIEKVLDFSN